MNIKDNVDCHLCKALVIDPKNCKECCFMFCKSCLIENSQCPKCLHPVCEPTGSNILNLDKIILRCKFDCDVPLSQAISHLNNCPKLKMDIDCWNCNNRTFSKSMIISEELKNEVLNINISNQDNNFENEHVKIDKKDNKGLYIQLINLQDNRMLIEDQLHEIKIKLKLKEFINDKIKKLEIELIKGESIDLLRRKFEEKSLELKALTDKIQKINTVNKENFNEIELNLISDVIEKNELNLNHKLDEINQKSNESLIKFKEQTIDTEKQINNLIKLNETDIICEKKGNLMIRDLLSETWKSQKSLCNEKLELALSIKLLNENLLSFSEIYNDNYISIYDISLEKEIVKITETDGFMKFLKLNETQILSLNFKNKFKIWDFLSGDCIKTFDAIKGDNINCLIEVGENLIATGGKLIMIWNIQYEKCIHIIIPPLIIEFLENLNTKKIAGGSSVSKSIRIWNKAYGTNITLDGHVSKVKCIAKVNETHLASGSEDLTIKIWDFNSGICIKTLTGHTGSINKIIRLNDSQLASASADKTIKVWDI